MKKLIDQTDKEVLKYPKVTNKIRIRKNWTVVEQQFCQIASNI